MFIILSYLILFTYVYIFSGCLSKVPKSVWRKKETWLRNGKARMWHRSLIILSFVHFFKFIFCTFINLFVGLYFFIYLFIYLLADVCQNYQTLSDKERKYTYPSTSRICDDNLDGWYRFQEPAGTKMLTTCPPLQSCGTAYPGWLRNGHPTVAEGIVARKVCFHTQDECCDNLANIKVKNCSSYYIYRFSPINHCPSRYCGTDWSKWKWPLYSTHRH